jgi:hypothetical protein
LYDYPKEHWAHQRTSNPIESIFAGVRLRTNAAKRMQVRENALYLVFKLVLHLGTNWRPSMDATSSVCCSPGNASSTAASHELSEPPRRVLPPNSPP